MSPECTVTFESDSRDSGSSGLPRGLRAHQFSAHSASSKASSCCSSAAGELMGLWEETAAKPGDDRLALAERAVNALPGARYVSYPLLPQYHMENDVPYFEVDARADLQLHVAYGLLVDARSKPLAPGGPLSAMYTMDPHGGLCTTMGLQQCAKKPDFERQFSREEIEEGIMIRTDEGLCDRIVPDVDIDQVRHSSLVGGRAVAAAGMMTVHEGRLLSISNESGHYAPPPSCLRSVLAELALLGVVELDEVQLEVIRRPEFEPSVAGVLGMEVEEAEMWMRARGGEDFNRPQGSGAREHGAAGETTDETTDESISEPDCEEEALQGARHAIRRSERRSGIRIDPSGSVMAGSFEAPHIGLCDLFSGPLGTLSEGTASQEASFKSSHWAESFKQSKADRRFARILSRARTICVSTFTRPLTPTNDRPVSRGTPDEPHCVVKRPARTNVRWPSYPSLLAAGHRSVIARSAGCLDAGRHERGASMPAQSISQFDQISLGQTGESRSSLDEAIDMHNLDARPSARAHNLDEAINFLDESMRAKASIGRSHASSPAAQAAARPS